MPIAIPAQSSGGLNRSIALGAERHFMSVKRIVSARHVVLRAKSRRSAIGAVKMHCGEEKDGADHAT